MLTEYDIVSLRASANRTIELKRREAEREHDWVVDSHSLSSCQLLELLAVAELGLPILMNQRTPIPGEK